MAKFSDKLVSGLKSLWIRPTAARIQITNYVVTITAMQAGREWKHHVMVSCMHDKNNGCIFGITSMSSNILHSHLSVYIMNNCMFLSIYITMSLELASCFTPSIIDSCLHCKTVGDVTSAQCNCTCLHDTALAAAVVAHHSVDKSSLLVLIANRYSLCRIPNLCSLFSLCL